MEVVRRQTVREEQRLQQAARRQPERYAEAVEREKNDALAAFCPGHPLDESAWTMREMQANLQDRTHALRCLRYRVCDEWSYTAQQYGDKDVNIVLSGTAADLPNIITSDKLQEILKKIKKETHAERDSNPGT